MISFRGFRKVFGLQVAVDGLTLEVRRGETLALLGPNGSGKTTTLKAAAGLITPSAGEVLLGDPGRAASLPAARDLVSFLPQRVTFPDALTGRDVLEFYRRLRGMPAARTDEVLRVAALNGAASRAVGTYSGGMTQRLGLAVAVLPDAPVFLLDEPTAALDPDGLAAFYAIVERHAAEGRTVLFTSHQLGDVERLADRFAVLVAGRLVAVLTQRDLHERLARRGVMRVRASGVSEAALARLRAVAPGSEMRAGEILVPGAPSLRPASLDALRAAGVEVLGLTADEGRLDEFYRELIGESG
jgi:Cu-processing system ATP-binding protein